MNTPWTPNYAGTDRRPVKFRAWDKLNKRWYEPTHEAYRGQLFELMVSFQGHLLAHVPGNIEHETMWPDRFVLVQFTGLHDKNGREVYEHDVIRNEEGDLGEVIYSTTCGILGGWTYHYHSEQAFMMSVSGFRQDDPDDDEKCNFEVIGSILENPDLIPRPPQG
jgi:uncharacterized phage protein (TIGR01671 family)